MNEQNRMYRTHTKWHDPKPIDVTARLDALKAVTEELLNMCDSGDLIASTFEASKRVYETKEKCRKLLSGI